jgi:hypothetical protein
MLFKTNKNNIAQIKAVIESFGQCYFHGDGNLYADEKESDFRKDFSNPKNDAATYRVKFTAVSQVPETLDELNNALLKARNNEVIQSAKPKEVAMVKTITVAEEKPVKSEPVVIEPAKVDSPVVTSPEVPPVVTTDEPVVIEPAQANKPGNNGKGNKQ